jgi:hypothetical protein
MAAAAPDIQMRHFGLLLDRVQNSVQGVILGYLHDTLSNTGRITYRSKRNPNLFPFEASRTCLHDQHIAIMTYHLI